MSCSHIIYQQRAIMFILTRLGEHNKRSHNMQMEMIYHLDINTLNTCTDINIDFFSKRERKT